MFDAAARRRPRDGADRGGEIRPTRPREPKWVRKPPTEHSCSATLEFPHQQRWRVGRPDSDEHVYGIRHDLLPTIRQPRSAALRSNSSSSRRATRPPRIRRLYFRHHTTCSPHRAHRAACAAKPALRHATNVTKRHRQTRDHTLFTSPDPPMARSRRSLGAHSMHRMICACDDPVGAAPSRGDAAMWGSPTSGRYPHPLAMRRSGAID
jgi:hypothetical protein